MKILRTINEVRSWPRGVCGFVPTMGALHEGHLSLVHRAKDENDDIVLSIFVNPTQFGPNEDFSKYPRPLEQDLEFARAAGVDAAFVPSVEEIYDGSSTSVKAGSASLLWEGERRPGHFDGVATVVAKLFNIVQPDRAYFGQKDFQQCAVIRQMVADLKMPVEITICPTLREPDGLAMSSRNIYLSKSERTTAPELYRALQACAESIRRDARIQHHVDKAAASLEELGFFIEYFDCVNARTLERQGGSALEAHLIVAARLGTTRLIDNLAI